MSETGRVGNRKTKKLEKSRTERTKRMKIRKPELIQILGLRNLKKKIFGNRKKKAEIRIPTRSERNQRTQEFSVFSIRFLISEDFPRTDNLIIKNGLKSPKHKNNEINP